ncbi:MAG: D-sedoheptulose-7-phosphate isomerase [Planctomycetota bacterium]|jgi:D-sedoheptulose 7-phosphate isomerase
MSERMSAGIDDHLRVVEALRSDVSLLQRIADAIVSSIRDGGTVYVFGNGGSAADAQHIAAELLGRYKLDRRALPTIALTANSSILTAVGNDLGAEQVFARQVEGLVRPHDVVWVLSVSGTSTNVMRAVKKVKEIGATLIGFTGESGGELAAYCEHCLRAAHRSADRVQEAHELAYHLICEQVEAMLA